MPTPTPTDDIPAKLDAILLHLDRLDRRDRLRTWGGLVRSVIAIVPVVLLLWASWYAATHMDELIKKISEESAKAAAAYTQEQSADFMERMRGLMPQ